MLANTRALRVLACITIPACSAKDPYNPGTPLGTYHVVAKRIEDTCGAGAGSVTPWEFDIRLARDPGRLYWMQGAYPVAGTLDANAHAVLIATDTRTIHEADSAHHQGYCGLSRDDHVELQLSADDTSFAGSLRYDFSPSDGSDCSDQLAISGGSFEGLPCTIRYDLSAHRTAAPTKKP